MNATDVIGYTADADVWCPDCAEKAYGIGALGVCPQCRRFTRTPKHGEFVCDYCEWEGSGLLDNEGNQVHPIFAWDEFDSPPTCGVCHEEL